jgi:hypothetical protein
MPIIDESLFNIIESYNQPSQNVKPSFVVMGMAIVINYFKKFF